MAWVIERYLARTYSSSKTDRSRGLPTQAHLVIAERIEDRTDGISRAIGVLVAEYLPF
jgi:hypothetical protein